MLYAKLLKKNLNNEQFSLENWIPRMCGGSHRPIKPLQPTLCWSVCVDQYWPWWHLSRVFFQCSHFLWQIWKTSVKIQSVQNWIVFLKSLFLSISYHFAFTQGGYRAVFQQVLSKHWLVLYLITVLWTFYVPRANFIAPESCSGDGHWFLLQSIVKALPSGIFNTCE